MVKHPTHHEIRLSISPEKLKKLANGHRILLDHHELKEGHHHLTLHHETAKKIHNARKNKKGVRLGPLSHEEIIHSGSLKDIFNSLKSGFNKYVKPVLSGVGDAIAYSNPELAPIREGVRQITGVGVHGKKHLKKGSHEAKEHMAKVRAARKSGGSFRLN